MAGPTDTEEVVINGEESANKEVETTLDVLLRRATATIFSKAGVADGVGPPPPVVHRIRAAFFENVPLLKEASTNTGRKVIRWTRRGSPLRALLVISVGTITLLALTGLLVFMLFFLVATVNVIVISLLMSLAAAGGLLALFFACLTAVYIGALSVAVFVISTTTISAMIAVMIATGWIGFFWTIWLVTKKSVVVAKHSLSVTGSAISAYSSGRHARRFHGLNKAD